MKKTLILACALALAGVSNVALATEGGTAFVRAEVGNTDVDFDLDGFGSGSDSDSSYSIRGGYYFNPNFAVEAHYTNLYDQSEAGSSVKLSSFGAGVVGKKNLGANNSGFFFSGRAGLENVEGEVDDGFGSASDNSTNLYYGVGAGYDFNEMFGVSLNYDFRQADFDGLDADADTLSLGGEVRF
ncbi:outer membrane beta-barrel protein [Lysobacter niabensis]|uniref:outer membrane beta-barrel protein n=1 Tax=Agrilutibacter niabensis TaxID=380628 RepID=UPI00360B17B5